MPFDTAATSALTPSPNVSNLPVQTRTAPQLQAIVQLMAQHGLLGGGQDLQGLTFGSDPGQPSAPVRKTGTDIEYSKPQGSFQTVGERRRADSQALYHGIASTIKTAGNYLQDKKVRAMSMDTTRLMSAYSGLNEAKASGDQAAMQHNAQIINDMMSDPKKVKMFEKVFNVPLMGDDKKKDTPEYKGFMDAMKKFQTDKGASSGGLNPRAAMLTNAMPQRMQTDPRLQALMEATKAGVVPTANAQLQANVEIQKVLSTAQQKGFDRESKENIAKVLSESRDRSTQAGILKTVISAIGRQGAAEVIANASKYRADKMYDSVMNNPKWDMMKKKLGGEVEDKSLKGFSDAIDKQMKSLQTDKKEVDAAIAKDKSWFGNKELTTRQQELNKKIDTLRQKQDAVTNYYMQKHDDGLEEAIPETDSGDKEFDLTPEEQQQLQELYQ
jgi:hypothetical protein